jgi:hypothetical protein
MDSLSIVLGALIVAELGFVAWLIFCLRKETASLRQQALTSQQST